MAARWSKYQEQRMCDLFEEGKSIAWIAKYLGRTPKAIVERYRYVLGNSVRKLTTEKMAEINRKARRNA